MVPARPASQARAGSGGNGRIAAVLMASGQWWRPENQYRPGGAKVAGEWTENEKDPEG